MKALGLCAVTAGSLLVSTAKGTRTIQWDIQRKHHSKPTVGRRATGSYEEIITNEVTRGGYFATCTLGTPGQDVTLQLDTGSSDTWVPWGLATECERTDCELGTFNPNDSSTFTDVGQGVFSLQYVDGSHVRGDYFMDTFQIAGATVSNVTMGLGKATTLPYGLVGVGYTLNEAVVDREHSLSAAYPNLPAVMMNEGLIPTNAYSLWLNDLDANTGNILFGGIDTEKYVGDLTSIDILKDNQTQQYDSFLVPLTSMEAVSSSGTDELTSTDFPIRVILDSGTTLSYLPTDLAEQIWTEVGAVFSPDLGLALLPCRMQNSRGYLSFGFAGSHGPKINVTMDELVLDLVVDGPTPSFISGQHKGEDACEFGIQNSSSNPFLLGDTFLRSAYVVYDLVNNQIGIASTDMNATGSHIVAFQGNGAQIPFATPASNQSPATATSTFSKPAFVAASGFREGTGMEASCSTTLVPLGLAYSAVMGFSMLISLRSISCLRAL